MLLSSKHAKTAIKILCLLLAASFSFFFASRFFPESPFIQASLQSIEKSNQIILALSGAALSASLALSMFPTDIASPLAEKFADISDYVLILLLFILVEKLLLQYGIKIVFSMVIPSACLLGVVAVAAKNSTVKQFAIRLCTVGLAAALVVPCSTHFADYIAADHMTYIESTISQTEEGTNKLTEVNSSDTAEGESILDGISSLLQTAFGSVTSLIDYFNNSIRRCLNSVSMLIFTNILTPLFTLFSTRWLLKEFFQIDLRVPSFTSRLIHKKKKPIPDSVEESKEPVLIGE